MSVEQPIEQAPACGIKKGVVMPNLPAAEAGAADDDLARAAAIEERMVTRRREARRRAQALKKLQEAPGSLAGPDDLEALDSRIDQLQELLEQAARQYVQLGGLTTTVESLREEVTAWTQRAADSHSTLLCAAQQADAVRAETAAIMERMPRTEPLRDALL